jgi:hypothetical protein
MGESRLHGRRHQRILAHRPPADEGQSAIGLESASEIGERRDRVGKEHHAESRVHAVGAGGFEGMRLGVGPLEEHIGQRGPGRPRPRDLQHGDGDINPQDGAPFADASRQFQGRLAASATDIDETFPADEGEGVHRSLSQRPDHVIEPIAHRRPCVAGRGVPIVYLVGVAGAGRLSSSHRLQLPCPALAYPV